MPSAQPGKRARVSIDRKIFAPVGAFWLMKLK
jgi:hypothetical protein